MGEEGEIENDVIELLFYMDQGSTLNSLRRLLGRLIFRWCTANKVLHAIKSTTMSGKRILNV